MTLLKIYHLFLVVLLVVIAIVVVLMHLTVITVAWWVQSIGVGAMVGSIFALLSDKLTS